MKIIKVNLVALTVYFSLNIKFIEMSKQFMYNRVSTIKEETYQYNGCFVLDPHHDWTWLHSDILHLLHMNHKKIKLAQPHFTCVHLKIANPISTCIVFFMMYGIILSNEFQKIFLKRLEKFFPRFETRASAVDSGHVLSYPYCLTGDFFFKPLQIHCIISFWIVCQKSTLPIFLLINNIVEAVFESLRVIHLQLGRETWYNSLGFDELDSNIRFDVDSRPIKLIFLFWFFLNTNRSV